MTTSQAENIKGARATQKLLLIDGDRDSAGQVRDFLGQHQYTVRVVSTAREAARILEAESDISLIITDFSVERQDAFEILRLIRSQRQYSKIPVLVCSEVGDKETVVRAYELGARDFMVKPVNPQILLTKVQRALQAHIRTVLIVDDNEMITDILARILEIDGYRTIVARDGEQALESLKNDSVSVMISDINMPGMNGLDLARAARHECPELKILLITGQVGRYSQRDADEAGADGYIAKPFKNIEILRVLSGLGGR